MGGLRMKRVMLGCALAGAAMLLAVQLMQGKADMAATKPGTAEKEAAVEFVGGYETDPVDKGRPVVLIAAALKVKPEEFRKAFSKVRPAPGGERPEPEQVRKNKAALMAALEPLGVTNDRLDEVSNWYRYRPQNEELWKHREAKAVATVKDGVVTSIRVIDGGAGYSSTPTVKVAGAEVKAKVTVSYGEDLRTNGAVTGIAVGG
jgi:hypothetical protein